MKSLTELDAILAGQSEGLPATPATDRDIFAYGATMAAVENSVVVISDMARKTSRIFPGAFAAELGIRDCRDENSIWEKTILRLLSDDELEAKILSELQFYRFIHTKPKTRRHYYLLTRLRFRRADGSHTDVAHRMHYVYDSRGERVKYAVCTYAPLTFPFKGRSLIVDSVRGTAEELAPSARMNILSPRELQVLDLIDKGHKSCEIAAMLHLSVHTVSRHRQAILAKLQVRSSIDACRLARSLSLL